MTTMHKCPLRKNANYKMLIFMFSGIAYLLFGAIMFREAELENEIREKEELLQTEEQLKAQSNLTDAQFKLLVSTALKLEPHRYGAQWTFAGAFYFAITVVTTIGYGHCVPHTHIGKLICIVYAIFGIPLWLITFQSMGERLNTRAKHYLKIVARKTGWFSEQVSQTQLIVFGVTSSLFTILVGIIAFANFENWSYRDSAYYSVMTLSTIGFGDYVALQEHESLQQNVFYVMFSFVYIIFGLAIVGAFLNLTMVKIVLCKRDCSGNVADTSCDKSENNYKNDESYSTEYNETEETYEKSKETMYSNPKCFMDECDNEKQSIEDNEESKKKCYKDKLFDKLISFLKFLSNKLCCCCMFRAKLTTGFDDSSSQDEKGLISETSSTYSLINCNKNNNKKLVSLSEDAPVKLNLSVFTTSNNKDDAEDVVRHTGVPTVCLTAPEKQRFNNEAKFFQRDETKKTMSNLNVTLKPYNVQNPNIAAPGRTPSKVNFSTRSENNINILVPNSVPFVPPADEQWRHRHQSCSLPNQLRNETDSNGSLRLSCKPPQYRRMLLTKNVNLPPVEKKQVNSANKKPVIPFKHKAVPQLTRHNSDPQRIQEFCRQSSIKISTNGDNA